MYSQDQLNLIRERILANVESHPNLHRAIGIQIKERMNRSDWIDSPAAIFLSTATRERFNSLDRMLGKLAISFPDVFDSISRKLSGSDKHWDGKVGDQFAEFRVAAALAEKGCDHLECVDTGDNKSPDLRSLKNSALFLHEVKNLRSPWTIQSHVLSIYQLDKVFYPQVYEGKSLSLRFSDADPDTEQAIEANVYPALRKLIAHIRSDVTSQKGQKTYNIKSDAVGGRFAIDVVWHASESAGAGYSSGQCGINLSDPNRLERLMAPLRRKTEEKVEFATHQLSSFLHSGDPQMMIWLVWHKTIAFEFDMTKELRPAYLAVISTLRHRYRADLPNLEIKILED
jgi:hypothetical protein